MDKLQHYFIGSLISFAIINSMSHWFNYGSEVGFGICAIGFLLYEVYQKVTGKGVFDWWDWFFGTMAAGVILITSLVGSI